MALDLLSVYRYCKVDPDDREIQDLIDAAEAYIINLIDMKTVTTLEEDPVFCLAVKMLVLHWYDNRGGVISGPRMAVTDIPIGIQSLITQLTDYYHVDEVTS